MIKRLHIFVLYFCIVNTFCYSQSLTTQHFTNNDGLSLSENFSLFQDSRGFIWIGINGGGVDMYNGKNFVNYSVDKGLHDIVINSIAEDNQGNIWFGSPTKGIAMYNGLKFSTFNQQKFYSQRVSRIFKCQNGDLLVLTESGLIKIQNALPRQLTLDNNVILKDHYIDGLAFGENKVAIVSQSQITILNSNSNTYTIESQFDTDFEINRITQYDDERIIVIASDGALYFYNWKIKKLDLVNNINKNNNHFALNTFVKWNNQFLAGTDGNGIYLISGDLKEIKPFKIPEVKSSNVLNVSDILIDFNNNIWVSTIGDGLIYLKSSKINSYNEGMASSSDIFYITKSKENILAASYEYGLFMIDKNGNERVIQKKNNPKNYIGTKTLDNGEIICFMGKDLFTYNEASNTLVNTNIYLKQKEYAIIDVLWGSNNKKYLITTLGIFDIANEKNPIQLYENKNSNLGHIIACKLDSKNNLWFSDSENNYILKSDNTLMRFDKITERCNGSVLSFMEDNYGNMWLLTNQCLAKYNGKTVTFIENKLLFNKLYYSGIYSKINNTIWLGTNDGAIELALGNDGQINGIDLIDSKVGFAARECNQYAIYEETDGKKIWFSTIKGIVSISKNRYTSDTTMPKLGIIDLRILLDENEIKTKSTGKSKWFNIPENLELPYNKNHIAIGFSGIQYINPEKIKYRYKLVGYDTGYCVATSYNYASYTNLPPGQYTLEVIANNSIGVWTKTPVKFNFSVERPYWKTWWFYTIISMGIIAISSFYYYYRKRQVVILEKRLEEEVSKRTFELKKQNDKIEILIKEIHHRVKNNLQVITSLINLHSGYVKDPKALEVFEESKNRIKSMALVHEKLYETNDLSSISVDDFIMKMFDYLRDIYDDSRTSILEKQISVAKLDIDTVIPLGLLINEIFSNAFKYALKDNPDKKLVVELKAIKNKKFELKISDTGKGFNYETKRKSKSSFGLELIDLLVNQLNGDIQINTSKKTEYIIQFESIGKVTEA